MTDNKLKPGRPALPPGKKLAMVPVRLTEAQIIFHLQPPVGVRQIIFHLQPPVGVQQIIFAESIFATLKACSVDQVNKVTE